MGDRLPFEFEPDFHRRLRREEIRKAFGSVTSKALLALLVLASLSLSLVYFTQIKLRVDVLVMKAFAGWLSAEMEEEYTEAADFMRTLVLTVGTITRKELKRTEVEERPLVPVVHFEFDYAGTVFSGSSPLWVWGGAGRIKQGKLERGAEAVRKELEAYDELEPGDPILVLFQASEPRKAGAMTSPVPLFVYGIVHLVLLLFLIMHGWQLYEAGRHRIGLRHLVRYFARCPGEPSPRAALEEMKRQGLKQKVLGEYFTAWGGVSPFDNIDLDHCGSKAVRRWVKRQPKPVDFDIFLTRLDFALDYLYGKDDFIPVLNAPIPTRVQLNEYSGPLSLDLACRARELLGESFSIQLDLQGLVASEALRIHEETGGNRVKPVVETVLLGSTKLRMVVGYEGYASTPARSFRYRISRDGKEVFSIEMDGPCAVSTVYAELDGFYCCPWRWKAAQREMEFLLEDGQSVRLHLSFEPDRELRIERR